MSKLLLALCAIFVLSSLGTWQLHRAQQKKEKVAQMQIRSEMPVINLADIKSPTFENWRFTPMMASGQFISPYTFLLDNQVVNGRPGYRVLSVFKPNEANKLLLIDRGWITRSPGQLPVIAATNREEHVVGIINKPITGIVLKKDRFITNATWPVVLQSLDFDLITQYVGHPLYDFTLQLGADNLSAFTVLPTTFGITPAKHIGYCVQWFAFAGLVALYYVISSFNREKN